MLLNTFLNGYARTLRWDRAFALLKAWIAAGVQADKMSYVHLLRACVNARVPTQAASAMKMMQEAKLQPDVRAYSMLLTAYSKAGMLRASLATLQAMRSEGVRPNGHIYAGLMETCLIAGQSQTALELFEQMCAQGIAPDVVSYTLLIRATLAPQNAISVMDGAGNSTHPGAGCHTLPRAAIAILDLMVSDGGTSAPNRLTYNALILGCLAHGADDLAYDALSRMLDMRISPNRQTFEAIASAAQSFTGQVHGRKSKSDPAAALVFLRRSINIFASQRRRATDDVYLAALAAAEAAGDASGAGEIIDLQRRTNLFDVRKERQSAVWAAEEAAAAAWREGASATASE